MFGKIMGAAADAAGEAVGALGDLADKAQDAAGFGVPGKEQLNQLSESLASAEAPISQMKETVKNGVPTDAAEAAKGAIEGFVKTISEALDGDAKSLVPAGAGCVAACWIGSIKKKLGALSDETAKFAEKAAEAPKGAMEELNGITKAADTVSDGIKKAADVPKAALDKIKEGMSSPDKIGDIVGEIEGTFKEAVKVVLDAVASLETTLTGVLAKLVSLVEEIINDVMKFLSKAPSKLKSAFKPPAPICCCCCCGVGEALDRLEEGFSTVIGLVKLDPLLAAVKSTKESLDGVDLSVIKTTMSQSQDQLTAALKPAKEAAEKMKGGVAGKLRDMATGGKDDAPAAPDV